MSDGPPASGRGRDVSEELAEVRTVLGRAENARETLVNYRDGKYGGRGGRWEFAPGQPARYVGGTTDADPDVEEMIAALDEVIARLGRWRRTGRRKL